VFESQWGEEKKKPPTDAVTGQIIIGTRTWDLRVKRSSPKTVRSAKKFGRIANPVVNGSKLFDLLWFEMNLKRFTAFSLERHHQ